MKELRCRARRTAIKWCKDHDVLLTDRGKIPHAIKIEFMEQLDKPFINDLKSKHGNKWELAYKYCKEGNITGLHLLLEELNQTSRPKEIKRKHTNKYDNLFDNYGKARAA